MKKSFIVLASILLILDSVSFGQTSIPGGDIYGVWGVAGSPFLVEGTLTVPTDSTLSIEPGVIVEFQGYYSIQVQGRLLAIGTASDSILFTVNDTTGFGQADTSLGAWNGIRFTDTPVDNDTSKLIHCCLQFSKAMGPVWHLNAGGAISMLQFGKVVVDDCLIRNNMAGSSTDQLPIGGGLYLFKSDALIRNNIFMDNRAHSGGAVYMDDSNPVFRENLITGNRAEYGAGVAMGGTCSPTFSSDVIINNVAGNHGGGLYFNMPSVVTCDSVFFSGNSAIWGGGIGVGGGELYANNCKFSDNYAELWGGGVAGDFATLHIDGCAFSQDSSSWGSGGLHMDHAVAEIYNTSFTGNKAVFGGGFHALFSQVSSVNNEFIGNQTDGGGGIHLENSDCLIEQCQFEGNRALNGTGGAIDCWADSTIFGRAYQLDVIRNMFLENVSTVHSGAIRIEQPDTDSSLVEVVIDSCNFVRNHSDMYGPLIIRGPMNGFSLSNSIFQGNTSTRRVGGPGFSLHSNGLVYNCVFNSNYAQLTDSTINAHGVSLGVEAEVDFINCTFTDTSSSGGIGLGVRRGAKADLLNCIFWGTGDRPVSVVTAAELGSTVSVNYCNIENGSDSIFVSDSASTLLYGEGNLAMDPKFVDLQGGDLHLRDLSPCIGSGTNAIEVNGNMLYAPPRDIEGLERPLPGNSQSDMGAYEHPLGIPVGKQPGYAIMDNQKDRLVAYPNPFYETVAISYQLEASSFVELNIYNILGQQVESLVSAFQTSGIYRVNWNAEKYEGGTYLCRITTNSGSVQTVKLLLLR